MDEVFARPGRPGASCQALLGLDIIKEQQEPSSRPFPQGTASDASQEGAEVPQDSDPGEEEGTTLPRPHSCVSPREERPVPAAPR